MKTKEKAIEYLNRIYPIKIPISSKYLQKALDIAIKQTAVSDSSFKTSKLKNEKM